VRVERLQIARCGDDGGGGGGGGRGGRGGDGIEGDGRTSFGCKNDRPNG